MQNGIFKGEKRPIVTIVMDGVGLCKREAGNAVRIARTPTLDRLMADYKTFTLKAHGTAVGLPSDDDMGNSEVGHNALGAGQIFAQGAKLVTAAIESGKMFASEAWKTVAGGCAGGAGTLHFIGLFSDAPRPTASRPSAFTSCWTGATSARRARWNTSSRLRRSSPRSTTAASTRALPPAAGG